MTYLSLGDSGSMLQMLEYVAAAGETPTLAGAMLQYLMDELRNLKVQVGQQTSSGILHGAEHDKVHAHSSSVPLKDEDNEDNVSIASSKIEGLLPPDHGRWKSSKAAKQARGNFIQTLKDLTILANEENWGKWDSYCHTLVESLELQPYVFGNIQHFPMSHAELMGTLADGDDGYYATHVMPNMSQDIFFPRYPVT